MTVEIRAEAANDAAEATRHGSSRSLAVPLPENTAEGGSILVTRRHYTEHEGQALLHS
jgi:hypothetical protein